MPLLRNWYCRRCRAHPRRALPGAAIRLACLLCLCFLVSVLTIASPGTGNPVRTALPQVALAPGGFASKFRVLVVPKAANNPDEPPFMNGEPEHARICFDDDKLSEYTDYMERQLLVYPVDEYGKLFKGREKKEFDSLIGQLRSILALRSLAKTKTIPVFPAAEAYQVFHVKPRFIDFAGGSGLSFITCYAQEEAPVKNGDFFYTFQGLSKDGKYCIAFFCPLKAPGMPDNLWPAQASRYLAGLKPGDFTPGLSAVDKMLSTISLK